jgi:hypothetical protein
MQIFELQYLQNIVDSDHKLVAQGIRITDMWQRGITAGRFQMHLVPTHY